VLQRAFLVAISSIVATAVFSQEGPGRDEFFGANGKLYSVERVGSDVLTRFLLLRRPISGEDGFYYDGKIRTRTEVAGGGYMIEESDFFLECSSSEPKLSIRIGRPDKKFEEINVSRNVDKPRHAELNAFNLWWATCKNTFRKFR